MSSEANWRHGTRYAYRKKGCRCDECKAWRREEARREQRSRPRKYKPRGWKRDGTPGVKQME